MPQMLDIHPLQPESTVQGILQVMYEFMQIMKEISGMVNFSFQPGGGSQAIYTNARMVKAYHEHREDAGRDEIITTLFSHPVNAACPQTAGFKVITLEPGANGYPEVDSFKRAVSERTAGLFITNPEDTGIYNPYIEQIVKVVDDAGGICVYDQANANGLLGITRARDAGFDLCHFNLHKTFSSPHGSGGPGAGAIGASEKMEPFLPVPIVEGDGTRFWLDENRPLSIGKVRAFFGVPQVVLRAYAWVMSLGAEGLKHVAETAVLNNNYLLKKMLEIPGVSIPYPDRRRIEQVRYTLKRLTEDTGVTTDDMRRRVAEHVTHYWTAHHPVVIPEPTTMEPTESYSKAEIDDFVGIIRKVAEEAYRDPNLVKNSPHDAIISRIDESYLDDPQRWAMTWRAYLKKRSTSNK
jgi:glycine dehydrogenase subunit 2